MYRTLARSAIALVLLLAACDSGTPSADEAAPAEAAATEPTQEQCPTEGEEFETTILYIEHNATDEDTGVHGLFGGEATKELCITAPNGSVILFVDPLNQFDDLAVADVFFESREPANDEMAIDEILAAFPEGEYRVSGTDFEGTPRVGTAVFTHDIPAEPNITAPVLVVDPEEEDPPVVPIADLLVEWEPVTQTIDGEPVTLAAYELIVTDDDYEETNALSRPEYDVHVGPAVTSLVVPAGFFEPDTLYEVEVLALDENGNQTLGLGFFQTEG